MPRSIEPDSRGGSASPSLAARVEELLAEQRSLTAVERFAQRHEQHAIPAQAKYYRDLIPLSKPGPGQQYAFEVDLDKCSGCKACVSACHSLNGLDDGEAWRDVGLLFNDDWRKPFQQTVTAACHHCVDPGCLSGCPVLAYDKDPATGIVRHLDDQCIGCQYCVMKCPYEVPKYSASRGIVRKCDMCHSRLAEGEAPACVQACPGGAIRITLVETQAVKDRFVKARETSVPRENAFLPASPAPEITLPTTRYISARPLPAGLLAADHAKAGPAPSHLPLVFLLVFTQLGVGAATAALFVEPAKWLASIGALAGALGMGAGLFHLGKPLKAWRAFLGWRKSWFSREVIFLGAFVPLALAGAAAGCVASLAAVQKPLLISAVLMGLPGVFCSAMIYADTHREFWRASWCLVKFPGTALLLGLASILVVQTLSIPPARTPNMVTSAALAAITLIKLAFEHRIFRHLVDEDTLVLSPLNKTARLLEGRLGLATRARISCAIAGGLILPLLWSLTGGGGVIAIVLAALCLAGELLERYLFFTAVAPVKMPGGVMV